MSILLGSSGFEVTSPSPAQLVIVAHHSRLALWICGVALLASLILYLRSRMATLGSGSAGSTFAFLLLVGGVIAAYSAVGHGQMNLDRSIGVLHVERTNWYGRKAVSEFPLDDVDHAEVRTSGPNEKFCIVFRAGGCIGLKGYVNDSGQYEAVAAVNNFLNVRRPSR